MTIAGPEGAHDSARNPESRSKECRASTIGHGETKLPQNDGLTLPGPVRSVFGRKIMAYFACPGLFLSAMQIFPQLCGQSLLACPRIAIARHAGLPLLLPCLDLPAFSSCVQSDAMAVTARLHRAFPCDVLCCVGAVRLCGLSRVRDEKVDLAFSGYAPQRLL